MDWTVSRALPEAANGKLGITQSIDPSAWPNRYLYLDSSCGFSGREEATMVSQRNLPP